jgi:hypothetical protein
VDEGREFDLLAASMRADARDLDAFLEALAVRLEEGFPESVAVERKGGGLLARKRRVQDLNVVLNDRHFGLTREDGGRVVARVRTVVRGIALKTEEPGLDGWIDELTQALVAEAGRTGRGREALERLIT